MTRNRRNQRKHESLEGLQDLCSELAHLVCVGSKATYAVEVKQLWVLVELAQRALKPSYGEFTPADQLCLESADQLSLEYFLERYYHTDVSESVIRLTV